MPIKKGITKGNSLLEILRINYMTKHYKQKRNMQNI